MPTEKNTLQAFDPNKLAIVTDVINDNKNPPKYTSPESRDTVYGNYNFVICNLTLAYLAINIYLLKENVDVDGPISWSMLGQIVNKQAFHTWRNKENRA